MSEAPQKKQLSFVATLFIGGMHLTAMAALVLPTDHLWYHLSTVLILHLFVGFSVTAGLHRYWAHKSYDASKTLRFFMLVGATMSCEGPIVYWAKQHRMHHRYSDSDLDPHDARRGLFWSHVGCYLYKWSDKLLSVYQKTHDDDLMSDPLVKWQAKYFLPASLILSLLVPAVVAKILVDEFAAGLAFAAVRTCVTWHCTWAINSLAHRLGSRKHSPSILPADSVITSFISLGEGYHNYHHTYPADWRGNDNVRQFSPTTWALMLLDHIGLAKTPDRIKNHTD